MCVHCGGGTVRKVWASWRISPTCEGTLSPPAFSPSAFASVQLCIYEAFKGSDAPGPPAFTTSVIRAGGVLVAQGGQEGGQEGGVGVADDGACRNDNGQCGRGDAC